MKRIVHAACPHDCPDACGVLITVEDGRATRIQGDPAHPVTRGFLCAKVAKYLDRVYSPQRVLYPLRRVLPKGPASPETTAFARVSWDQALEEIAARFRRIAAEFGAEAILPYSYGGTLGALNNASMDRRFFHRLGASRLDRTICSEAGGEGLKSVLGAKLGTEPEQFRYSRLIIAWGANIHGNNIHLWPFIEEARRDGAKLVVIDPYRTRTARCADWYLPVNPGTDVALALALMHVLIGEGLYDADYVARHTMGFEALRERVQAYPPEVVAPWTGIVADDIRRLAREYASIRPSAIRVNYGVQRGENGGMAVRAIAMLPCLTGSWKEVGGGLQLSTSGAFRLNRAALEREDLGPATRSVNMVQLGSALRELTGPPVKALFVYNANPAAAVPNHEAVVQGLRREDLFTVVHEQFLTDTCDYADLVLPATTFFEHQDLQSSYGHHFLQWSSQAIDPLGEARSNVALFSELARRMGFEEACFRDSVEDMIDEALDSGHTWLRGISRARLQREGHVRLNLPAGRMDSGPGSHASSFPSPVQSRDVGHPHHDLDSSGCNTAEVQNAARADAFFLPFAEGHFSTPSGKAEFHCEALAKAGLDPVATFVPPVESRHSLPGDSKTHPASPRGESNVAKASAKAGEYPLEFLPRKCDHFLNSTFANLPCQQRLQEADVLEMNRADAAARGIEDGDTVRVFNARGAIHLRARVDGAVQPGVVAARLYWAKLSAGGRNVNTLTSERLTDLGGGPTFYSTLVEVEKFS
jgi:anaerobic selenocysteine-containing dehydrogenase